MNIRFDVDDTLTETEKYNIEFWTKVFAKENLSFKPTNIKSHMLVDIFTWKQEDFLPLWEKYGQEYKINLPLKKYSKNVINYLKNNGHKIFIISKRFTLKPYEYTIKWLEKNNLYFDELIIDAKDKIESCKKCKIDFYIDDSIENCITLNNAGIKTINIITYFNKNSLAPKNIIRVKDLKEYLKIIEENKNLELSL